MIRAIDCRLLCQLYALCFGCMLLSCAGNLKLNYQYTEKGVKFTSVPSGVRVELIIEVKSTLGSETHTENRMLTYTTPYDYPLGRFIKSVFSEKHDDMVMKVKYRIVVSKPGYHPLIKEIDGVDMQPAMRFILKPKSSDKSQFSET